MTGDLAGRGVLQRPGRTGRVVPHRDLLLAHRVQTLGEPGLRRARLPVLADQVDVEVGRLLEFRAVDLRLPVLGEPGAAEGVDHGRQRRPELAPAGQAAQADAPHAGLGAVDLGRDVGYLLPGRALGHRDALRLHDVLVVHEHRRLAVERQGVELAVGPRQRRDHRLEQVGLVEARVLVGIGAELVQPAVLLPDGYLVGADGGDVVLTGLGGDVLGDLVAQLVLGKDREVHLDPGVLRERVLRQLRDVLHLRVADHQHVDALAPAIGVRRSARPATGDQQRARGRGRDEDMGHSSCAHD
ncbi:hypothetical protein SAURM35S_00096 [Streptomyces aurantiogriseus]